MKRKPPRNEWNGPMPWHEPIPKKKTPPPARRWSAVHLIPIALLSTIAGAFMVRSCTEDDESDATASGSGGGYGWFHRYGSGGSSHSQHGTDRGGFGSRGRSFFS